jgi:hypothetical protein
MAGKDVLIKSYEAAMGAFSSLSPIPFIGPVLGGAAFAGIMATGAGLAGSVAGLFADGGVIPGNETEGDRLIARVNSGEMILNQKQQSNLFNAVNNADAFASGGVVKPPANMTNASSMQRDIMETATKESKKSSSSTEILENISNTNEQVVNELRNVINTIKESRTTLVTTIPGKQFPSVKHNLAYS